MVHTAIMKYNDKEVRRRVQYINLLFQYLFYMCIKEVVEQLTIT